MHSHTAPRAGVHTPPRVHSQVAAAHQEFFPLDATPGNGGGNGGGNGVSGGGGDGAGPGARLRGAILGGNPPQPGHWVASIHEIAHHLVRHADCMLIAG